MSDGLLACPCCGEPDCFTDMAEAVAAWNSRVTPPVGQAADVERLPEWQRDFVRRLQNISDAGLKITQSEARMLLAIMQSALAPTPQAPASQEVEKMVTALEHIYKNHCASRCLIEAATMLRRLDAERGELLAECQAVGAHNMEQAITIANLTAQLRAASQADVRSALEPLLTQVEEEENRVWARRYDEPQDAETLFVKLTWEQVNTIKAALSTLPTAAAVEKKS